MCREVLGTSVMLSGLAKKSNWNKAGGPRSSQLP